MTSVLLLSLASLDAEARQAQLATFAAELKPDFIERRTAFIEARRRQMRLAFVVQDRLLLQQQK